MLRDRWPKLAFLVAVCSTTVSATEELQNISPLQTLGLGLRDLVLRMFTLCGTELLALRRDTSEASGVHNTLCTFLLKPQPETGRGHYGPPAYNTSGFDPLTLLAGLAFLAFLLQTLHALLYRQTTSVSSVGLSRKISDSPSELEHTVKSALDKYEMLNSQGRMTDNTPWQWPSLPLVMRNLMYNYLGLRYHLPCFQNPLCHQLQPKS
ncbi:uncharacterized protein LOC111867178 isoform X2 [Cryptotermes secundus]|uniref:uncharacterized protein LOC111867178 isoform X2 n=1 Tax=Cryptotermes secundus TaxID=105785 RepID=UPI001454BD85|nr:uncharacterized protein LOC111867178 isoform X2 [Cryptotermes secundus]